MKVLPHFGHLTASAGKNLGFCSLCPSPVHLFILSPSVLLPFNNIFSHLDTYVNTFIIYGFEILPYGFEILPSNLSHQC